MNFASKVSANPTQLTPYYAERLIMQKGADMIFSLKDPLFLRQALPFSQVFAGQG
jgi:hypothetical protein